MVDKGYYQCGFRINNKEYLKLMFGKSTIIGAYNIIFLVRHEFSIKTVSEVKCFSIRLDKVREIFEENPQYLPPIQRKALSTYAKNIYFPLMRMKREII